jgi:hypothetical protein
MTIYQRDKDIQWNLDNIRFLYPPDDFTGSFANAKMQERHKATQEQKIKVLLDHLAKESHPLTAMLGLHKLDQHQFLHNNLQKFRMAGCLEETVLLLFYRNNTPFALIGYYDEWLELFTACDPEKIAARGKSIPFEITTAYRGSLTGNAKGLSWTINREEARWFLERWQDKSLGGGTVFALEVSRSDVLVYIEDERRREIILRPEIVDKAIGREITNLAD